MAPKIKITYIMPSMASGGAERFLLDLLQTIDRERFDPLVILFKEAGRWHQELEKLNLPIFILSKKSKISLANFWQIYKLLKKERPAIVHTQLGGDLRGRLAAKLAGVKIIVSTEQNINRQESWYQRWAKIITSLWTEAIVAISPAVAKDMHRRYFLPWKKCELIIPNGIPLKKFEYQEKRPETGIITVGAVGRLNKQKGFDILIEAWLKVKIENTRLIIAGEGEEREVLQKQIEKLGLSQQISLIGNVQDMSAFYQSLNLLVMPSRWEGLGIAALEAGACGVPVVASAVDGLGDIINENTGWSLIPNDAKELARVLQEALSQLNSEVTRFKQAKLRTLIEEKYSINQVTVNYEDLYLKLWRQHYENIAG
jgi:glycosyltransferase involved in cell wall biosynthesis